jgi:hypothetical protein
LAALTINDVEDFAARMQQLGDEYGYVPLSTWGGQLAEQTGLFDLEGLQRSLAAFPEFIGNIQTKLAADKA